jgi:Acyl-CoA synthetase (NDP forming)
VENGCRFINAAARYVQKKPVVALKVGKREPGARAASAHTRAVNGRSEAYKAAFRKAGIIEVAIYEELKDACKVLNRYQLAEGKRILIISLLWGPPLLTLGVAMKLRDLADSCGKPILICSPGGKFSRETASLFTEIGISVFFTPDSAVREALILCEGER